ncbi:MAG: tail protein X [Janthinobacterium lividum]
MTDEVLTVTGKPMPLDLLLYRRFKREVPGLVEATYRQNRGLADLGPVLPLGTAVTVTPPAPAPATPVRTTIKLYD